ncbi:DUF7178 family protein [Streptomyces boninensis]|uniref:DUF7178 family protein n=1 Tax=Streptomyces boninensis TaxID=2039455 RepID=UPI003B217D4F
MMVTRIIDVWSRATCDLRQQGRQWYPHANKLAADLTHGDVRRGAGVIAALSPQCPWSRNVQLARAACAGQKISSTRDRASKAQRILAGEDPHEVLPTGIKTWHFFRCIADPADDRSVVVDRHAHDIAMGARYGNASRGLEYQPRYDAFVAAYRCAAQRLGVRPSVLQATTWLVWTEHGSSQ